MIMMVLENFSALSVAVVIIVIIRLIMTRNGQILFISVFIASILCGLTMLKTHNEKTWLNEGVQTTRVLVKKSTIDIDGDRLRFTGLVKLNNKPNEEVIVTYKIQSEEEKNDFLIDSFFDYVELTGSLSKPNQARNFNQFDYRKYLYRNQIYWIFQADTIRKLPEEKISMPFSYRVDRVRTLFLEFIDRILSGKTSAYIKTLLFADKREMSESTLENYRDLGVIHLLSISGLHIQFMIALVRNGLLKCRLTKETTAVWLLVFLPIYGYLSGFGVSVFRAIVQALIATIFTLLKRPSSSLDNWALTLMLALLIDPYQMYSAGFQLSYLLSCLLILLSNQKNVQLMSPLKQTVVLNCTLSIVSIPVLSFHFFEFSWIVILLNFFFIPLFSYLLLPLLVSLFILGVLFSKWPLFKWVNAVSDYLLDGIEQGVKILSESYDFSFVVGRLSVIGMIFLVLGILVFLITLEKNRGHRKNGIILIGCLLFFVGLFSEQLSPVGKVMMIDVGQGDSLLIKQPFGKGNYLIDTGGLVEWKSVEEWRKRETPFAVGEDIVLPTIKSLGVNKLHQIYLSHADADHIGALEEIIQGIQTQEILATQSTFLDPSLEAMMPEFKKRKIPFTILSRDLESVLGPGLRVIYPDEDKNLKENQNKNEASLVLYGKIGRYRWLFTGDLEATGEEVITQMYPNLAVDILKVAHHGSSTSSQEVFLDSLRPKVGWISSGVNNIYGHPNPEVLSRLEDRAIDVYRTDLRGAVLYEYYTFPFIKLNDDRMIQVISHHDDTN
ncbi:DNA internalization-related competence protein ComEC/Rec2 [Marinilactibacillus sp. Marseille-P9653]|uniref:DNA internalization-related competence protein ComEC/Rec2 n=1 Tax=Marinilactibacillus sp. Marseille-P9653 TaxID=2866583 RepID=UPI00351D2C2D